MNSFMEKAKFSAEFSIENNEGGPFGAIIVDKNNKIISIGTNKVLIDNDPTAHAEIVAIRNASFALKTYDLSECTLYTSCEPCPMCLSAIIWANIKKVYYGCTRKDANDIGFRDDIIYEYIKGNKTDLLDMEEMDRDDCLKVFEEYKKKNGVIY